MSNENDNHSLREESKGNHIDWVPVFQEVHAGDNMVLKIIKNHAIKCKRFCTSNSEDPRELAIHNLKFGILGDIKIFIRHGVVAMSYVFPFKVHANMIPMMSIYISAYNQDSDFANLKMDPFEGVIYFEYKFFAKDYKLFSVDMFWRYFQDFEESIMFVYEMLEDISNGILSKEKIHKYQTYLISILMTLDNDFDMSNMFGLNGMEKEFPISFIDERESKRKKLKAERISDDDFEFFRLYHEMKARGLDFLNPEDIIE